MLTFLTGFPQWPWWIRHPRDTQLQFILLLYSSGKKLYYLNLIFQTDFHIRKESCWPTEKGLQDHGSHLINSHPELFVIPFWIWLTWDSERNWVPPHVNLVDNGMDSTSRLPGLESQILHSLPVRLQANFLTSPCLNFLLCIRQESSTYNMEIFGENELIYVKCLEEHLAWQHYKSIRYSDYYPRFNHKRTQFLESDRLDLFYSLVCNWP